MGGKMRKFLIIAIIILNVILVFNIDISKNKVLKRRIMINEKFLGSWSDEKQDIVGFYNTGKKIYASSEINKRYRIENIVDGDITTCWATRLNGGIGEQVLFGDPHMPGGYIRYSLAGIILYNGYCKSKELYYKNNRIKKLRIDIYRVIVYPIETEKGLRWYTKNEDINLIYTKRVILPDKFLYKNEIYFNKNLEKDFKNTLKQKGIEPDYLLLFTIEEIYKGTKYNDLCVSEIKFLYKK